MQGRTARIFLVLILVFKKNHGVTRHANQTTRRRNIPWLSMKVLAIYRVCNNAQKGLKIVRGGWSYRQHQQHKVACRWSIVCRCDLNFARKVSQLSFYRSARTWQLAKTQRKRWCRRNNEGKGSRFGVCRHVFVQIKLNNVDYLFAQH